MKKIFLVPFILIMLVSVSCTFGVVNEVITPASITPSIVDVSITTSDTIPNTEVPVTTTTTTTTKPIVVTPLVINKKEDLLNATSDIVYPAVIMFNNYIAGVKIQTWYLDDKTPVFGHNSGDVMCIDIYNANDYNAVFNLEYTGIHSPSTYQDGNTIYQPEPRAKDWVTIKNPDITLLAHQLLGIPVSLNVPVGIICPDNWEFRITVTDVTNKTQIYTNEQVRFLVSMMKP